MAVEISLTAAIPPKLLGARIRRARKLAELSHDQLGVAVGSGRQHLIRLEQGLHRPKDDLLGRIAEATGQPLAFFTRKPTYKPRATRELTEEDRDKLAAATAPLATALIEIMRDKIAQADVDLEEVDAA